MSSVLSSCEFSDREFSYNGITARISLARCAAVTSFPFQVRMRHGIMRRGPEFFPTAVGAMSEEPIPKEESLRRVVDGLRDGDEDAAAEIVKRFGTRLAALARSRLGLRMRQKVDADDILQSVFRSFFRRVTTDELAFDSWNGLWALLTVVTMRKCGRWVTMMHAIKRDVRREQAISPSDNSASSIEPVGAEPTPEEAAILADTLEKLMASMDEHEKQIIEMRLQGFTASEMAQKVNLTERTIHRVLQRARSKLEKMAREE